MVLQLAVSIRFNLCAFDSKVFDYLSHRRTVKPLKLMIIGKDFVMFTKEYISHKAWHRIQPEMSALAALTLNYFSNSCHFQQ